VEVRVSISSNVIRSRIVLRNKYGKLEQRKARIIAQRFAQHPGMDFGDTFAPVARLESIRTLMALAAQMNMAVEQIDITTAYLNSTLDETVYMEVPNI